MEGREEEREGDRERQGGGRERERSTISNATESC